MFGAIPSGYPIAKDQIVSRITPYKTDQINYFLGIGDSIEDGAARINTPCPSNTLFLWDGNGWTEITTQSVTNDSPDRGSRAQPFAMEYKSLTGNPVGFINAARGGSVFTDLGVGSEFSWSTNGLLYNRAVIKARAALANRSAGLTGIFINLAINDVRGGQTLANITSGATSLFSRLEADFPGVPKLVILPGRTETSILSQALYEVREMLIDLCNANANFHVVSNSSVFSFFPNTQGSQSADRLSNYTGGYEFDGVHPNHLTYQVQGKQLARWFYYQGFGFSKWGRSVISTLMGDIPAYRRVNIDSLISSQVSSGNYFRMDEWHSFKINRDNNLFLDLSLIGYGVRRGSTYTTDQSMDSNGVDNRFDMAYVQPFCTKRATKSNIYFAVKVKTNNTAGTAYLAGMYDGASSILGMSQSTGSLKYCAFDGTLSAGTDATFQNGNRYGVGRTGGTKKLFKNKVVDASASVAVGADIANRQATIGALNNNGTISSFISGSYEDAVISEHDSFDTDSYNDNTDAFNAAW